MSTQSFKFSVNLGVTKMSTRELKKSLFTAAAAGEWSSKRQQKEHFF